MQRDRRCRFRRPTLRRTLRPLPLPLRRQRPRPSGLPPRRVRPKVFPTRLLFRSLVKARPHFPSARGRLRKALRQLTRQRVERRPCREEPWPTGVASVDGPLLTLRLKHWLRAPRCRPRSLRLMRPTPQCPACLPRKLTPWTLHPRSLRRRLHVSNGSALRQVRQCHLKRWMRLPCRWAPFQRTFRPQTAKPRRNLHLPLLSRWPALGPRAP